MYCLYLFAGYKNKVWEKDTCYLLHIRSYNERNCDIHADVRYVELRPTKQSE